MQAKKAAHMPKGAGETHSLVLKRPALLNSASLPLNRLAGPLNGCRVLSRRLISLHDRTKAKDCNVADILMISCQARTSAMPCM